MTEIGLEVTVNQITVRTYGENLFEDGKAKPRTYKLPISIKYRDTTIDESTNSLFNTNLTRAVFDKLCEHYGWEKVDTNSPKYDKKYNAKVLMYEVDGYRVPEEDLDKMKANYELSNATIHRLIGYMAEKYNWEELTEERRTVYMGD